MIRVCALIALLLSKAAVAQTETEIAQSPYWQRLIHTRGSAAVGPSFYLSGSKDPLSELRATLAAFQDPTRKVGTFKLSPQCAFPERFRYLQEALALKIPILPCPEFVEWKRGLKAKSATIVFSSSYANNPASLFGHLLLRLDGEPPKPLQDYGVNFAAAVPDGVSSVEYGIYGLTGGFQGFFLLAPYYEKIGEYNNSESRDLWEYKLRLSPEQVDRLVNHLWELYAMSSFDYYFLSENCAYQILALLEVAEPRWNLLSQFAWYVIPSDAVHALKKVGAFAGEPLLRLSARHQYSQRVEQLSAIERVNLEELLAQKTNDASPHTLETAIAYYHYRKYADGDLLHSPAAERERELLLVRAKQGSAPEMELHPSRDSQPDLGHFSSNLGVSGGFREGEYYNGIFYHVGVHDLVQNDKGFTPNQEIAIAHVDMHFVPLRRKLRLGSAKLFQVTSLVPWEHWDPKLSWTLGLSVDPLLKADCRDCYTLASRGGAGWSFAGGEHFLAYQLLEANAEWSSHYSPHNFWLGPALRNGILWSMRNYKTQIEALLRLDLFKSFGRSEEFQSVWRQSLRLGQAWDLESSLGKVERINDRQEWNGELRFHYFY